MLLFTLSKAQFNLQLYHKYQLARDFVAEVCAVEHLLMFNDFPFELSLEDSLGCEVQQGRKLNDKIVHSSL